VLLRSALALVTTTALVPVFGLVSAQPAPTTSTGTLDVAPHCRLLPADQQPDRDATGSAAPRGTGAAGQVVTLYIPATTCNTPH
jgi:hypothetical protein